ncbi:MAG: DUF11 domain-containing protein, partial [Candidatus Krumholzibacteriota bacterium]|nr:DUF11 domain-containing protein [Candidatus Krumholzibacteriota bacterium]
MRSRSCILILLLALWSGLVHSPARAEIYTLPALQDTWVDEGAPAANHGGTSTLLLRSQPGDERRALIQFDLSGIPGGSTVIRAILRATVTDPDANGLSVVARRVTDPWTEAGATFSTIGARFDPSTNYGSYVPIAAGVAYIDLSALAQLWVDTPGTNYGTMLLSGSSDMSSLASREWPSAFERPTLIVTTAQPATSMRMSVGSYDGDDNTNRQITGLGFEPDMVWIKGTVTNESIIKTATMAGNISKPVGRALSSVSGRIEALDPDGFTVGNNIEVNASGDRYYWMAFLTAPGELAVGKYTGDGSSPRTINGLGFDPAYVVVFGEIDHHAMQRFAAAPFDESHNFTSGPVPNVIRQLTLDGFELGNDKEINTAGEDYHYIAWADGTGLVSTGSYAGTGSPQPISAGLQPDFVVVRVNSAIRVPAFRSSSWSNNVTGYIGRGKFFTDGITSMLPSGFQLGTHSAVNGAGEDYYWTAFRSPSLTTDLVLDLSVSNAAPRAGEQISFPITVINKGPEDATNVAVQVPVPAGLTYSFHFATGGTYDPVTGVWDIGLLAAGSAAGFTFWATVDATAQGQTITTLAAATMDQNDLNAKDNIAIVSIDVAPYGFRVVEVIAEPDSVARGETGRRVDVVIENIALADTTTIGFVGAGLSFSISGPDDEGANYSYALTAPPSSIVSQGTRDTLAFDVAVLATATANQPVTIDAWVHFVDTSVPRDYIVSADTTDQWIVASTNINLDDTPATLYPASVAPGATVALRVSVDNAALLGVTIDTTSTISFTDGVAVFTAALGNNTYVPPSATDFTLTFRFSTVPLTMTVGAYPLSLDLRGIVDGRTAYQQLLSTAGTNAVSVSEPQMMIGATPLGWASVYPGDVDVALLSLSFQNPYPGDRTLDSLVVTNAGSGAGSPNEIDAMTPSLSLYADRDSTGTVSAADSLLATASFTAGRATLTSFSWIVPSAGGTSLIVAARVDSTLAIDGNVVDLVVTSESDIVFAEPTAIAGNISPLNPLDSFGYMTIDGSMAHQLSALALAPDTLDSGASGVVLARFTVPANGSQPDTLHALEIADFSGSFQPGDFSALYLYADDGDGSFSLSDLYLGPMAYSGDRYEITGLGSPVSGSLALFIVCDISGAPTSGDLFRPGIPTGGVE